MYRGSLIVEAESRKIKIIQVESIYIIAKGTDKKMEKW